MRSRKFHFNSLFKYAFFEDDDIIILPRKFECNGSDTWFFERQNYSEIWSETYNNTIWYDLTQLAIYVSDNGFGVMLARNEQNYFITLTQNMYYYSTNINQNLQPYIMGNWTIIQGE